MKTIITIAFILISSVCYGHVSGERHAHKQENIEVPYFIDGSVLLTKICYEGYRYIVARTKSGVSITQMFVTNSFNGGASPIKCKDNQ